MQAIFSDPNLCWSPYVQSPNRFDLAELSLGLILLYSQAIAGDFDLDQSRATGKELLKASLLIWCQTRHNLKQVNSLSGDADLSILKLWGRQSFFPQHLVPTKIPFLSYPLVQGCPNPGTGTKWGPRQASMQPTARPLHLAHSKTPPSCKPYNLLHLSLIYLQYM